MDAMKGPRIERARRTLSWVGCAFAVAIAIIVSCGCFSAPPNNLPFREVRNLSEFLGTYLNAGQPSGYLSAFLWQWEPTFDQSVFEVIEVSMVAPGQLTVRARNRSGRVLLERTYTEGREFSVRGGTIRLERRLGLIDAESGIFGIEYGVTQLGLDTAGDAKASGKVGVAGLGYMIVPIAGIGGQEIRFKRIR